MVVVVVGVVTCCHPCQHGDSSDSTCQHGDSSDSTCLIVITMDLIMCYERTEVHCVGWTSLPVSE